MLEQVILGCPEPFLAHVLNKSCPIQIQMPSHNKGHHAAFCVRFDRQKGLNMNESICHSAPQIHTHRETESARERAEAERKGKTERDTYIESPLAQIRNGYAFKRRKTYLCELHSLMLHKGSWYPFGCTLVGSAGLCCAVLCKSMLAWLVGFAFSAQQFREVNVAALEDKAACPISKCDH